MLRRDPVERASVVVFSLYKNRHSVPTAPNALDGMAYRRQTGTDCDVGRRYPWGTSLESGIAMMERGMEVGRETLASTMQAKMPGAGQRWAVLIGAFVFSTYIIQVFSPLRLNADAVTLLNLTAKLTDGQPYLIRGARPVFPVGVPLLFSTMERLGAATPVGFAVLNLACLGVAAFAAWVICRTFRLSHASTGIVLIVSFSSFVLFKHSVLPLTDIPYMAISLACLAVLEVSRQQAGIRWAGMFAASLALVAASIAARRVGIALIPAALYAVGSPQRSIALLYSRGSRARAWWVIGASLLIVAAFFASRLAYIPDFYQPNVGHVLEMRMQDFGELFLNVPASQLGRLHWAVYAAGPILLGLLLLGFYRERRDLRVSHVYLLAYMAILFVWPYVDARFWIPVLPLLAIVILQGFRPFASSKPAMCGVLGYLIIYGFMSLASAAYTTRITFAGDRFPQLYGSGSLREAYLSAWSGSATTGDAALDPTVRHEASAWSLAT